MTTTPTETRALTAGDPTPVPWEQGQRHLEEAGTYWLATVRPDSRPHIRPVLAVWVEDTLYTTSSPGAFKSKNLALDSRCVITTHTDDLDLVVEGTATKVTDDATAQRVADAYRSKYDWPVTVHDAAFDAPYGAPTAGDPPYEVYAVTPETVFGFQTSEKLNSTRWRF